MSEDYPRDLIGYGATPPHPQWPGEARIAVSFVLNYEEGGERNVLHGDAESEAFLSEMVAAQPLKGARNLSMESLYEYGSRAGVWRILRLFRERRIPLTVFAVAMAAERHPEVLRAMVADGHEICSHGYRWIDYQNVDEATEREHLQRATNILRDITGTRPLGWYTGRTGPNTRRLVREEGGFWYDSDTYDDDLPYWDPAGNAAKPHLVIPYTLDTNDMRFAQVQGFNTGEDFFQYLKDAFDVLYAEGAEAPKMLSIGLHCRLIGRPGRLAALQRFIDYAQSHTQVWFARRLDIAQHWHAHHREDGGYPAGFIRALNPATLSRETFMALVGGIYEHSSWVAERTQAELHKAVGWHPHTHELEFLHAALSATVLAAEPLLQLALIKAHPDLASKAAVPLTTASRAEQTGAGIDACTPEELQRFTELNNAYKAKFGFPFVMAVKGRDRREILKTFAQRLHYDRAIEFATALAEINKIAKYRLQQL